MYNTFLFDLYGTLVDIRTDEESIEVWQKLALFYGYYGADYNPNELKQAYCHIEQQMRKDAYEKIGTKNGYPEIVLEYAFMELFKRKGVEASYDLSVHAGQFFRVLTIRYIKLYKNIVKMLEQLKKEGKRVYLLSNAQQIFTEYEMNYLKIKDYFDGILFSSDAGFLKPDRRFYEKAIEKFHIEPSTAIMIGNDITCDIMGAKAVGLDAFYVHTNLSPKMPENLDGVQWMEGMDGFLLLNRLENMKK